ncbi:Jouberin [Tritrichomonas musculus]|uniref:Jouberin n=1 Tax=Tritrichomonas musculus TaxID=1915356 RepID=A0ABR2KS02_9EUKA
MGKDIFSIKVVGSTDIISNEPLNNVAVRISIVNSGTGQLLSKSKKTRKTFSQYENSKVIPPCQTRGINCNKYLTLSAIWDETFLYNEPISTILSPNVIIFFELIDCVPQKNDRGFHPVAWGFLKPSYQNKNLSVVDKTSVLQLYKYPSKFRTTILDYFVPVFELFQKKQAINSRLTVILSKRSKIEVCNVEKRPLNVFQKEIASKPADELLDTDILGQSDDLLKNENESQLKSNTKKCQVPKTLRDQIQAGENGALCLRYNHNGSILAAAVQIDEHYDIQFYGRQGGAKGAHIVLKSSFTAHLNLIHEISFSIDDQYLLSVSADGMAKVWNVDSVDNPVAELPHTCYLYSGKFHPLNNEIVATAGYDGVIKIWNVAKQKCIMALESHKTRINSIVFSPNGKQLFAGDASGCISVWDTDITEHDILEIKRLNFVIEGEIKGCCITHLDMGKSNLSLLVHTQDNIVRNFETKVMVPSQRYVGALCSKYRMESHFSPDGSFVIAGSENGSVMLWTVKGSDPIPVIEWSMKFSHPVTTIAWNPSDHIIAFSSFGTGQPILIYQFKPIVSFRRRPIPPRVLRPIKPKTETEDDQ